MDGQPSDRRWQLQEAEGRGKQWNLLDSEQDLDDRWQLQADDEFANYQGNNWQPIDTLPEERAGGSNWVLPSLVLVAVLAVAVYVAIAGFDGIGLGNLNLNGLFASADPNGTPEIAADPNNGGEPEVITPAEPTAAAVDQPVIPTEAPPLATATQEPPTSTPAPMIERRIATVREQYGLNARSAPSTVGDPVEIVPQGTQLPIWDEQTNSEGNWFYVTLPNNTLAWITASFVDVVVTPVTYDEMNALRQQQNLPLLPTPTSVVASEVPVEPTATPISNGAVVTEPLAAPPSAPLAVTAVISSPLGLNLRQAPDASATAITMLADSLTFPVVGRSEDGAWLQLQLGDATLGWAAAEFLRVQGDVTQLPVGGASIAPPTTSITPTTTAPLTTTSGVTTTTPATATLAGETIATITYLSGSRVREQAQEDSADVTILDFGVEVKALGRTADNTFIQVQMEDGKTGWVVANTVELNNPVDSLPIVVP